VLIDYEMKYDLHIHTNNSICSVLKPKTILKIAKRVGLDGIAVADHNSIKGGIKVAKLNKDKDFEVVPAIEINTNRGHVLGLYVNKDIRSRDFFTVSDKIREQGGLVVLAHPFRFLPKLRSKTDGMHASKYLDAIECYNGRVSYFGNRSAIRFSERSGLAKTGGSDSHFSFEIGRCKTIFEGSLIKAIKQKKTRVEGNNITGMFGSALSGLLKMVRIR